MYFKSENLESIQHYDWMWESKRNKILQLRCPCCDMSFIDLDIEMCDSCQEYYKFLTDIKEEN